MTIYFEQFFKKKNVLLRGWRCRMKPEEISLHVQLQFLQEQRTNIHRDECAYSRNDVQIKKITHLYLLRADLVENNYIC